MGILLLGLIAASLAMGESSPRAWNYVAPDASALVGIEWQHLRESFLADAVESELSSSGQLDFPDLDCLWDAREILLAGPDLLAVASGSLPAANVATQAARLGMKPTDYDGVRLWIAPGKDRRSLAQVSDTAASHRLEGDARSRHRPQPVAQHFYQQPRVLTAACAWRTPGGQLRPVDHRDRNARSFGERVCSCGARKWEF